MDLRYATIGLIAIGASLAGPAAAQTAADINRLNAAMQICGSPAGAALAECAQLRGALGPSLGPSYPQSAVDAQVQAAEAYRLCVAANPANANRCQAVLSAGALPSPSFSSPTPAAPPRPKAAPVDPLSALLGPKP